MVVTGRRSSSVQRLMVLRPTPRRAATWLAVRSSSAGVVGWLTGGCSFSGGRADGVGLGGAGHAAVGIDQVAFAGGETVLNQEGPAADFPEGFAPAEGGEHGCFGVGQAEQLLAPFHFGRGLGVDDAGFGVGEEAFDEADLMTSGRAGGAE